MKGTTKCLKISNRNGSISPETFLTFVQCSEGKVVEPRWTGVELWRFWLVIAPYMESLLQGDVNVPAPDQGFNTKVLRPGNRNDYLAIIHDQMWEGKYSRAVANFKSLCSNLSDDKQQLMVFDDIAEEMEALRKIFFNKY